MKVAWVTGDYPPDVVSGAADGSYMLTTALQARGVDVEVITGERWGISNAGRIAKRIERANADIVHMEYPTASYGSGLAPQVLSLLKPMVVRVHEVSHVHVLRRLALVPFSVRSRRIIFTTHFEFAYARRFAPWVSKRACVIPIWSQIPAAPQPQESRGTDIIHFGLFRRKKGIEQVIELASSIKQRGLNCTVRMVGIPDPKQLDYCKGLRARSAEVPIEWDTGLDAQAVAELLGQSQVSYMPFPDGVSERRGSLLALLANGVAVVTTRGRHTPPDIEGAVEFASSVEEALETILELHRDSKRRAELSAKAMAYASRFSLDSIADEFVKLYEEIVEGRCSACA